MSLTRNHPLTGKVYRLMHDGVTLLGSEDPHTVVSDVETGVYYCLPTSQWETYEESYSPEQVSELIRQITEQESDLEQRQLKIQEVIKRLR